MYMVDYRRPCRYRPFPLSLPTPLILPDVVKVGLSILSRSPHVGWGPLGPFGCEKHSGCPSSRNHLRIVVETVSWKGFQNPLVSC